MKLYRSFPVALLLAGCAATPAPLAVPASPLPLAASVAADGAASMPFRSLMDDGFGLRYLNAGADERVVLRSRSDLDAMFARHERSASWEASEAAPVPQALAGLDWGKWQAIAFVDGQVDVSATSRITGVIDRGTGLEVRTARWVAPPNPRSAPSPQARVHVVAIPRTDKPVTFAPTSVLDGSARPGSGGYGGPFPDMDPKWRAVPNPLVDQAAIEAAFALQVRREAPKASRVEKTTIAGANAKYKLDIRASYTPDSEVWLGIADGDFWSGISQIPDPGPRAARIIAVYPVDQEDPQPLSITRAPAGSETAHAN